MAARVTKRTEEYLGPANARSVRAWQDGRREGLRAVPTGDPLLDRWLRELFAPPGAQAARPPRLPDSMPLDVRRTLEAVLEDG